MDIPAALSAIGQAVQIVKALRNLDRDFDAAAHKAQIAELYSALADVKMALSDAQQSLHKKEQKIKELEAKIETLQSGDMCPICGTGRLKVTSSRSHPQFGFAGVQERTMNCENPDCSHSEKRFHDPENITGTAG